MIKICNICNVGRERNFFEFYNVKNQNRKDNCIYCNYIIYYYLNIPKNIEYNKDDYETIKDFLNSLLLASTGFHLNYQSKRSFFKNKKTIITRNDNIRLAISINIIMQYYNNLNNNCKKLLNNANIYIGQTTNPNLRHYNHKRNKTRLGNSIKKHGIDAFYVSNQIRENQNELNAAEIFAISFLKKIKIKNLFNISNGGSGGGAKTQTISALLKLKKTKFSKKTLADIEKYAEKRDLRFISSINEYHNPNTGGTKGIYKWQCKRCFYIKEVMYKGLRNCKNCSVSVQKTEMHYNKLAEKLNIIWTGNELPKRALIKTTWQCLNNKTHTWSASYSAVSNSNGCMICNAKWKINEKDYENLAKSKNLKWIGKILPKNSQIATMWECNYGHVFKKTYNHLCRINKFAIYCKFCRKLQNSSS